MLFLFWIILFSSSFVDVLYQDRTSLNKLSNDNQELQQHIKNLESSLDHKTHTIDTTDPVFPNIIYLLQAFNAFRRARNGEPCVLRFTAPADSQPMASMVAQFSNSVSGCFTFGPDATGNPDWDEIAAKGAIPSVILMHAEKDDVAANQLEINLGNQIQVRRTSKPIPQEINNFQLPPTNKKVWIIWLQFGHDVTWNSEFFRKTRAK